MQNYRKCDECEEEYVPRNKASKYCSIGCRNKSVGRQKRERPRSPIEEWNGKYGRDAEGVWWYYRPSGTRFRSHEKICEHCGETYVVSPFQAAVRKYCSRRCAGYAKVHLHGENAPRWGGGRRVSASGYIEVFVPMEERGHKRRHYMFEHRLVMAKVLGRPLTANERVHHKNGDKTDNRPENLELWKFGHPPGQRSDEHTTCPTCGGTGYLAERIT